jgi:hypothetical protein
MVIAMAYDYKGILVLGCYKQLPEKWLRSFRWAWSEIGCEPPENVEWYLIDSEEWRGYWASRRFVSDWQPL